MPEAAPCPYDFSSDSTDTIAMQATSQVQSCLDQCRVSACTMLTISTVVPCTVQPARHQENGIARITPEEVRYRASGDLHDRHLQWSVACPDP